MGTTIRSSQSRPALSRVPRCHRTDRHVMTRLGSTSVLSGTPTSPPRNSALCATSADAYSTAPAGEVRSTVSAAAA
eukprot:3491391-Prymnesium_polylepis.1